MTNEEAKMYIMLYELKLKAAVNALELEDDIKAFDMAIRALEQCESCDDCISRQAVFEQINCWIGSGEYRYTNATYYLTRRIKELSSINPIEPKTDILDKIRAEIDVARYIDKDKKLCKNANASGLEVAMGIIDKYRQEGMVWQN